MATSVPTPPGDSASLTAGENPATLLGHMQTACGFFFDPAWLSQAADRHRDQFRLAAPFPHVVIDGVLPDALLDDVIAEFPEPRDRGDWIRFDRPTSVKLAMPHDWTLGPTIRQVLNQFNSAVFVNFIESLTGIEGLIPDPHYEGGGLHQIERGGFLKVHADFDRHDRLNLARRLNVIVYLNPGWREEWGGHLELWDPAMTECVCRIAPTLNRMVVFTTDDRSYHGHPEPLACPAGTTRRSLAVYYYTSGASGGAKVTGHSSRYQARPNERLGHPLWKDFVPPIVSRLRSRSS